VGRGIPGIYFPIRQVQFFYFRPRIEIQSFEINPKYVGAQGRFKIIHPVFLSLNVLSAHFPDGALMQ